MEGVKDGWLNKELIEVCKEITDGSHFSPKSSPDYPYPYITVRDLDQGEIDFNNCKFVDSNDYKKLLNNGCKPNKGDLLFSKDGTVGKVALVSMEKEFVVLSSLAIIRPKNELIESELLEYILRHPDFLKTAIGKKTGVAIRRIILKNLKSINIQFPKSLTEQKQIVALLDQAFAAIDQAIANLEKNIQNAQELFQSKLNDVFSQRGEGWVERCLGDESLLKIIDGDRGKNYPKKSDFLDEGHCVFMNTGNVRPDGFDFSSVMFISKERDYLLRKGKLERNDVVMTTRGTIGNLGWYNSEVSYDHIRINSGMLVFRVNEEKILAEYLFTLFKSAVIKKQIKEKTSGAAQPQLPIKTLITFKIPFHSNLAKQKEMVEHIDKMEIQQNKLISIYQNKLKNLEELKKSILQKAFNGELT